MSEFYSKYDNVTGIEWQLYLEENEPTLWHSCEIKDITAFVLQLEHTLLEIISDDSLDKKAETPKLILSLVWAAQLSKLNGLALHDKITTFEITDPKMREYLWDIAKPGDRIW